MTHVYQPLSSADLFQGHAVYIALLLPVIVITCFIAIKSGVLIGQFAAMKTYLEISPEVSNSTWPYSKASVEHLQLPNINQMVNLTSELVSTNEQISELDSPVTSTNYKLNVLNDPSSSKRQWVQVIDGPYEIYLLSAFYDDRGSSLNSQPVISVLSLLELPVDPDKLYLVCLVQCQGGEIVRTALSFVDDVLNGSGIIHGTHYVGSTPYIRRILRCPLEANCHKPKAASLKYITSNSSSLNAVAVEYPERSKKYGFGICVPIMFGCIDPVRVVEWLEIQKILGVDRVFLYNNSVCGETTEILMPYVQQGFVEVIQNSGVKPVWTGSHYLPDDRESIKTRAALLLNDCMYRQMYSFRFLLLSDLDEVIVPQSAPNLSAMIKQIESSLLQNGTELAAAAFPNFYFLIDPGFDLEYRDFSQPNYTAFLQHRKRIAASPMSRHAKSLVSPLGCASITLHFCVTMIHEYKRDLPNIHELLSTQKTHSVGHNQHYRQNACYRTIYGVRCRDGANGTVIYKDDSMLRFAEQLKDRVAKHLGTTYS